MKWGSTTLEDHLHPQQEHQTQLDHILKHPQEDQARRSLVARKEEQGCLKNKFRRRRRAPDRRIKYHPHPQKSQQGESPKKSQ
jgi:hypothetical protein